MTERRALLDPEMYKISEEDSQDEEVLSGGRNLHHKLALDTAAPNSPWHEHVQTGMLHTGDSSPRGQKDHHPWKLAGSNETGRKGQARVKWPPSGETNESSGDSEENKSLSGDDGETDESRESDCWTCSSNDRDEESGDESWSSTSSFSRSSSSCSSCDSRNHSKISKKEEEQGKVGTDDSSFLHHFHQERKKGRRELDSNYLASESDIAAHMDLDGNVRIIEFYSSEEDEEEEDEEGRKKSVESLRSQHQIPKSSSELTFSKSLSHLRSQEAQKEGGGPGRISRFLNRNSGEDKRENQRRNPDPGNQNLTEVPGTSRTEGIFPPGRSRGEIRDVILTLLPGYYSNHGEKIGSSRSLLESLLGIIPNSPLPGDEVGLEEAEEGGRLNPVQTKESDVKDRILIGGFVPNSPAAKSRHLRMGDWVRTINGIVVNPLNVDFILSALQQRHPRSHSTTAKHQIKVGITRSGYELINRIVGDDNLQGRIQPSFLTRQQQTVRGHHKNERWGSGDKDDNVLMNPTEMATPIFVIFLANKSESGSSHCEHSRYAGKKSGEENINMSGGPDQATQQIIYAWPTKEERNASSEKLYESLKNTIPMTVTIYGVLKEDLGYTHARNRMEVGDLKMDAEFGSDDGGETLLLVMRPVGHKQETRFEAGLSVAGGIADVLTAKWGKLERAFDAVNHKVITRLLGNILKEPFTKGPYTFLPHLPLVPMDMNIGKDSKRETLSHRFKEEIHNQICQFDAGQCLPLNDDDSNKNSEEVHSIGVALFLKGKLVSTTLSNEVLRRAYKWTIAELNWAGKSRWPFCKRILLFQQTAIRGSTFSLIIGKDNLMMLQLLSSAKNCVMLSKRQVYSWVASASSILSVIIAIIRTKSTEDPRLSDVVNCRPWNHFEDTQDDGSLRPRRRNFIGNAWSNLKNKVTRKTFPAQGFEECGKLPPERSMTFRMKGPGSTLHPLQKYKILSVINIDHGKGVLMTYEEDWLGNHEEWISIQMGIRETMQKLDHSDECGHVVLNSSHRTDGVWVGGRTGSGGKKVIVSVIGQDAGKSLRKILDKIEHGN